MNNMTTTLGRPKGRNKKTISVTIDIDLLEVLRMLRTEPQSRFEGRSIASICSLLIADRLKQIKKETYSHLISS